MEKKKEKNFFSSKIFFSKFFFFSTSQIKLSRVGGRGVFVNKVLPVKVTGTNPSADLGGSSKYSNENFED